VTFRDWQHLPPDDAARHLHHLVEARLSLAQRRAVFATLAPAPELAAAWAAVDRTSPLAGVPFFAKDLFDVAGLPTLAGSTFLPEERPTPARDSTFVPALRAAGAVLAGKTHLHEFAYGITGENPHYGDCEHPRFPGRTSGGSSSGSAAVVAAGIAPFALGTDTGGSIRVPAAFCGIFGFRLTPRHPWIGDAFPLAPSFDTPGWFTTTAEDMRMALGTLIGRREIARTPQGCYLEPPGLDAEVAAACRRAAERFTAPAEPVVRRDLLEVFSGALETYHTLVAQEAWEVHRPWAERQRLRYDPAVWQRLIRAHAITPAQMQSAEAQLAAVRLRWTSFFLTYDFLALPATPCAALTKADCTLANRNRLLALTAPASLGGLPVLTIPVPLPSGLSTGLQIVVNHPQSPALDWVLTR
jgi:amidase/aspartyl-tRNA(Asn)/glutamyl-tRNA(Gln) amidotransferase subunit A